MKFDKQERVFRISRGEGKMWKEGVGFVKDPKIAPLDSGKFKVMITRSCFDWIVRIK